MGVVLSFVIMCFSRLQFPIWRIYRFKFPSGYKVAQVTPLLKKDGLDQDNPANYRPISNL